MTTDIYKISNSKIICRILPFYMRGRKMILFLEAVASPLINLHKEFLTWAYKMVLKTKITSQTDVIIWYLNYLFNSHFYNHADSFTIEQDAEIENLMAFNYREIALYKMVGVQIFDTEEEQISQVVSRPTRDFNDRLNSNVITIHAPKLKSDPNYTNMNYVTEIMEVINEYKTSFRKYVIEINEN